MFGPKWVTAVILLIHLINCSTVQSKKLLIVLVDGLRWDAFKAQNVTLPGYEKFKQSGVVVDYVEPVFPSDSYPNYQAIATGLYTESNGIVSNYMYDPEYNMTFNMGLTTSDSESFWWNDAEPIWIQAEKAGLKTALYYWPSCQAEIRGTKATFCSPYNLQLDLKEDLHLYLRENVTQILSDFKSQTYNLQMLYYGRVDSIGHKYDRSKGKYDEEVRNVDNLLEFILNATEEAGMQNDLNIYVVSDHGQVWNTRLLHLSAVIELSDVLIKVGAQENLMLAGISDEANERIYTTLKLVGSQYLHVYKKDEIPEEFHIKDHRRLLDLYLLAKPGYRMSWTNGTSLLEPEEYRNGTHGYWVNECTGMRGVTMAIGPRFKNNANHGSIKQVDHYQLFAKILDLPLKAHNGSWDRVSSMLQ